MAHKLEKFYNAFGGLDTRSNKLIVSPNTFRTGTKNMRYNFQDEIQKANGFQHKALLGVTNLGDIEYRFTDVNTGEAKSEHLCVGSDGLLYKKEGHYLKFSNLGTATSYSYYYDSALDQFLFKFDSYSAITVSTSMTMDQLRVAINALGPTCTIVDDAGSTVSGSTKLAYYIDVVINQALSIGVINQASSYFWTAVTYPSVGNVFTSVPFVTSRDYNTSSEYEGISYVNINNCCYITDGGFPMKYDGKCVARAGMAKILKPGGNSGSAGLEDRNLSGFSIVPAIVSGGTPNLMPPNQVYQYVFQHGYVDYQGVTILGKYETSDPLYMKVNTGYNDSVTITHTGLVNEPNFPIFSCIVNGNQNVSDSGATINVFSEHNIKAGMLLRIPISNGLIGYPGFSYIMSYVSAVTATTITLDFGKTGAIYPFQDNSLLLTGSRVSGTNTISSMAIVTTGNVVTGQYTITAIPSTAGMQAGDILFSGSFAAGTKIVSVDSATQLTVSNPSSTTTVGVAISANYGIRVKVGATVTGTGIPANTTITVVGASGSTLTMSNNATTNTTDGLTFVNYPTLLISNQTLNGGYAQDIYKNKISNPNLDFGFCPEIPFGAFTRVYRTTAGTDNLYQLIDLPLSRTGLLGTWSDYQSDTVLSRISIEDADSGGDLPRACKYLTKWQNQIVQAGRPVDTTLKDDPYPTSYYGNVLNIWGYQDTGYFGYIYSEAHLCDSQSVYWNDTLDSEAFPQDGLHEFVIITKENDKVKGVAPNKDALFAFKERSAGVISGSLADNNLTLEILEDDTGCANHRTIQEVGGSLVWLDGRNGFYSCVAGRLPVNIGFPISDYEKINPTGLNFSKAFAVNYDKENLYICSVGSTTFVFDYAADGDLKRNCWYLWDRFNVTSMLASADDKLFLNDGTLSWKMKLTNTKYDMTDHKSAIDMVINTQWINQSYPTVDKQFVRLWVNSIQGDFSLDFSQYGNYLDTLLLSQKTGVSFVAQSSTKAAVKVEFKAKDVKLSSISFGMRNNNKNEYVRIQGFEIEYSPVYDTGEPQR